MIEFIREFWEFLREKVLAYSYNNCFSLIWNFDCFKPRFCSSTIYCQYFMTTIWHISFYHDSAASLIVDGEIKAAAQEEDFQEKNIASHPFNATSYVFKNKE